SRRRGEEVPDEAPRRGVVLVLLADEGVDGAGVDEDPARRRPAAGRRGLPSRGVAHRCAGLLRRGGPFFSFARAARIEAALLLNATASSLEREGDKTFETPRRPITAGSESVTLSFGCQTPTGATNCSSRRMASTILAVTIP